MSPINAAHTASSTHYSSEPSSYNSSAPFYDVSWLVSGMVVKEWKAFCPCTLPMSPPSTTTTHEKSVAKLDSSYIMSCPAPTLENFRSLMPGLLPHHRHSAGSVQSYALRSSHFHPTKQPVCPVPTLWLDIPMPSDDAASANRNADIVKWFASPKCQITRLIVAGPPRLKSLNSQTLSYMSSFISSILTALLESTAIATIRHLVFYSCSLSDVTLWPLLSELLTSSSFSLESLACVHLQSGEDVESLLQILQHPQTKLSELILHGLSSFSFKDLLRTLDNSHSQLRRLSLTACNIGDKEMKEIALLLRSPSFKLTAINLSTNVFTKAGLSHLQEALIKVYSTPIRAHPLETLSLCGSQIYVRDEEVTKAMTEVIKSPGCALTTLDLTGRRSDPTWLAHLLNILEASSQRKKLRSLYLFHATCVNSDCALNDKLLEALKASTDILSIHFPWPTEAHKQKADAVMQRNARLKTTKDVQQLEKPCRIKLFLCGHERVGKTTLTKKLLHSSSVITNRAKQGMRMGEPVTQGMNLSLLKLPDKTTSVVICDFAGQRDYHAFHTLFMTSTNDNLFVVVCKYPEEQRLFEVRLQYWLKFIVSHRSRGKPKPMVMLVVNFFKSGMNRVQMTEYAKKATEATRKKFSALLDFGQVPGIDNVFGVNLSSVRASHCTNPIMTAVETLSYELMERNPGVLRLCKEISSVTDKLNKRLVQFHSKPVAPIMTVQELLCKYESGMRKRAASHNQSTTATPSGVDFEEALLELHKIGKVVYFRINDAEEGWCLEKQPVILDPAWFYGTLVGCFVKARSERHNAQIRRGIWTQADIHLMFIKENLCKSEHIDAIIKYLEKLELFFPTNSGQELIFPSMIASLSQDAQFLHWIQLVGVLPLDGYSFFGRRLDCKEKETSLIPFGVFARLQVQLHGVYGTSSGKYSIGYGWIQFCVEDRIEVFIRFAGLSSQHQLEDRHWIDTMVRFPAELPGLQEKAADIICQVNDSVFRICQGLDRGLCTGVDLEEFVLLEDSPSTRARPLSEVKEQVHLLVLRGQSTQNIGLSNCGKITELLLPGEWRGILKQMQATIQELVEEFSYSPDLEPIHDEAVQQLLALHDLSESKIVLHKLNEISSTHSGSMYSRFSEHLLRLEVAASVPEDALPLCPYLVDEQGKFRPKLKAMMHVKGARLHLMCESFHGCHEVRSQKGVAVTLGTPNQWLIKSTPVLGTALGLVLGAAIMAAYSFSPPVASFFPLLLESLGLDEFLKKYRKWSIPHHKVAFPQLLSSYLEGLPDVPQNLFHASQVSNCTGLPFGHLLRQFYRYVLEGKDVDMEQDFSLYHVYFPDKKKSLWVCGEHISAGKKQRPFNPFKDLALNS